MAQRTDFTISLKAADGTITTETRGSTSRTYSHAIVGTLTASGQQAHVAAAAKHLAKAQEHLADVEARMVPAALAEYNRMKGYAETRTWELDGAEWEAVCAELGIPAMITRYGREVKNTNGFCDATRLYDNAYQQIKRAPGKVQDAQESLAARQATVVGSQVVYGWAGRPDLAAKRVSAEQRSGYVVRAVVALESNGAAELREAKAEAITARKLADGQLVVAEPTTEELEAALAAL